MFTVNQFCCPTKWEELRSRVVPWFKKKIILRLPIENIVWSLFKQSIYFVIFSGNWTFWEELRSRVVPWFKKKKNYTEIANRKYCLISLQTKYILCNLFWKLNFLKCKLGSQVNMFCLFQSIFFDTQNSFNIIIIIIMKIIYIAPNPLKGSRRFTKSVTATLQFT